MHIPHISFPLLLQKLLLTLCVGICFQSKSLAQTEKNYSVNFKGITLTHALDSLEQLSGYRFFFSGSKLQGDKIVYQEFSQATLEEIIHALIPQKNLQIKREGNKVIILLKNMPSLVLSGYVREKGSLENLIGVNIILNNGEAITQTNQYGFFSLSLQEGKNSIRFSYIGFKALIINEETETDREQIVILEPEKEMGELVVRSEPSEATKGIQHLQIPVTKLNELPAFMGTNDPMRYLSLMPGVTKGNESNQGMFVRGGTPDQNLVLIDDATLYSAYHLFGLNSLFTGSELRKAELSKGGFSAKYGGRGSSVLNISLKDGNRQKWEGDMGVGVLASFFQVNGPVVKDKSSVLISVRRTYLDLLIKPFVPNDQELGYFYYDVSTKLNVDLNSKNRLYLSIYSGKDKFFFNNNEDNTLSNAKIIWGNNAFSARWNLATGKKSFLNTTVSYTSYKSNIGISSKDGSSSSSIDFETGINDLSIKTDADWMPNKRHWLKYGIGLIQHQLAPNMVRIDQNVSSNRNGNIVGNEGLLYIEDHFQIKKNLSLTSGLRLSNFQYSTSYYIIPEPRFQLDYQYKNNWSFNASYSHMSQYLNLISTGMVGLPSEIWIPVSEKLKPMVARQISVGYACKPKEGWYWGQEFFYKFSNNFTAYKEGIGFLNIFMGAESGDLNIDYFEGLLTQGNSISYGSETYLKYGNKKLETWFSYTLAKTVQQFDELNLGRAFNAFYDRRHDFSYVCIYKPNKHWVFSGTWVFGSGFALTLPESQYTAPVHVPNGSTGFPIGFESAYSIYHYAQKNGYRTRNFHKLDLAISYRHFTTLGNMHQFSFNVYNAYNRENPFYYSIDYNEAKGKNVLTQTSLFPVIPSFNWKYAF